MRTPNVVRLRKYVARPTLPPQPKKRNGLLLISATKKAAKSEIFLLLKRWFDK